MTYPLFVDTTLNRANINCLVEPPAVRRATTSYPDQFVLGLQSWISNISLANSVVYDAVRLRPERRASVTNNLPNWNRLHPNLRRSIEQQKERLFAMRSVEERLARTNQPPIIPAETFEYMDELDCSGIPDEES